VNGGPARDARIQVEALGGDRWRVRVAGRTTHEVTAAPAALQRAAALEGEPADETLRRTFDFLLEREPAESILSRFSLEDVARYFPDFWSVMSATR
jgi:hypothetical protein